jgi:hypothetical protein
MSILGNSCSDCGIFVNQDKEVVLSQMKTNCTHTFVATRIASPAAVLPTNNCCGSAQKKSIFQQLLMRDQRCCVTGRPAECCDTNFIHPEKYETAGYCIDTYSLSNAFMLDSGLLITYQSHDWCIDRNHNIHILSSELRNSVVMDLHGKTATFNSPAPDGRLLQRHSQMSFANHDYDPESSTFADNGISGGCSSSYTFSIGTPNMQPRKRHCVTPTLKRPRKIRLSSETKKKARKAGNVTFYSVDPDAEVEKARKAGNATFGNGDPDAETEPDGTSEAGCDSDASAEHSSEEDVVSLTQPRV